MYEMSVNVGAGGTSSAIAVSTTSAQSAIFVANGGTSPGGTTVIVTPSVNCFVRQGVDPTATNDGTDLFLLGGQSYRINVADTHRLAFRTASGSGTVYLTPRG
jgi:hypothetical protein